MKYEFKACWMIINSKAFQFLKINHSFDILSVEVDDPFICEGKNSFLSFIVVIYLQQLMWIYDFSKIRFNLLSIQKLWFYLLILSNIQSILGFLHMSS